MSFAIVLYHWSVPAPAPRPANVRKIGRRRKNGRCCVGVFARFNLCSEHRRATPLEHAFLLQDDERTITDPYNPTRVRVAPWNEAALGVRTKKRNTSPKACESKICQCHEAAAQEGRHQRGSKQRGAQDTNSQTRKCIKKLSRSILKPNPRVRIQMIAQFQIKF